MVVLAGSYVGFDGGTLQFQYRDRLMSHLPSISFNRILSFDKNWLPIELNSL